MEQENMNQEELVQEEVAQEEVAQEEVAQEEVAQEEVAQEEVVQEEVVQEEAAQGEVVQEEVAQEETIQEDAVCEDSAKIPMDPMKKQIITGAVGSAVFMAYFLSALYFDTVFSPNTTINGVDVSMQKVSDVIALFEENQENYYLKIEKIEGTSEWLVGDTFDFEYIYDGLNELKRGEMGWQWLAKLFTQTDYTFEPEWTFDSAKLDDEISKLEMLTQDMVKPMDASLTIDATQFTLIEETLGNTLDVDQTKAMIADAVQAGEERLNLSEAGAYVKPAVTLESEAIQKRLKEVDEFCNAEITYDFRGEKAALGTEIIRTWVRTNWDGSYYIDRDAARASLNKFVAPYETVNVHREFKNSWGKTITLEPGNYGWSVNTYTELNQILDDIANHRVVEREPAYYMTPYDNLNPDSPDDIGDTYIELDLSSQHMWYYLDGELFLETPITSGTLYNGWGTPAGVYYIYNRLQNVTLVGDDYRTPVDYWMQVNGGVGIHDSLWRSVYGGTEYLYNGSHGCINTPYWAVESLFWNIEVGVPVVIYY